jgi:hypothetical protein
MDAAGERGGAMLRIRYRCVGPESTAVPGRLEHFLTERYCLYTADSRGRLLRAEIHHAPWSLSPAEARIDRNTMAPPGIELTAAPDLLQCGGRQDVVTWLPERAG